MRGFDSPKGRTAPWVLRWSLVYLFGLGLSSGLVASTHLINPLTIELGGQPVSFAAGTQVTILKSNDTAVVVSLPCSDGSSVITQIRRTILADSFENAAPPAHERNPNKEPTVFQPVEESVGSFDSTQEATLNASTLSSCEAYPRFFLPEEPPKAMATKQEYTRRFGTFSIPINNVSVTVVYALPLQGNHLASSASNMIFYGPFPNENTQLSGNILPKLVTDLGCTVFSFSFSHSGKDVSGGSPYWRPDAGWIKAALTARDMLIAAFKLNREKLILFGYSGGAGMVMNFAGAYPDEIEAIAAHGPNVVPLVPRDNKINWLLLVNQGDYNESVLRPFYRQLRANKCTALFSETSPAGDKAKLHSPSKQTFDLVYAYIASILEQRRLRNDGDVLPAHLWPYATPSDPYKQYAVIRTADLSPDDLKSGQFDLLPSLSFARLWTKVCPPPISVASLDGKSRLLLSFPARDKPLGIVLYFDRTSFLDMPREIEDMNALTERGYLVVSTMTGSPESFANASIDWIRSQDKLNGLHVHLVAFGPPGAHFISQISTKTDCSVSSMSLIDFDAATYDDNTISSVTNVAKECGMYGFFLWPRPGSSSNFQTLADSLVSQGSRDRGCFSLDFKPSNPLVTSDRDQHLEAEKMALQTIEGLLDRVSTR